MKLIWTPQQTAIFDALRAQEFAYRQKPFLRSSFFIDAKAGSSKSTVCLEAMQVVTSLGASPCYIMFTRATVDEFKAKAINIPGAKISTAHSFGMGALKRALPNAVMVKEKVEKLAFAACQGQKRYQKYVPHMVKTIDLLKANGVGIPGITTSAADVFNQHDIMEVIHEDHEDWFKGAITTIYNQSISDKSTFDFSDMIFFPLLLNLPLEQFDYVFVDEAQDTNATRALMYKRMIKPWGCLFVVGDTAQAIYGFSGADTDAITMLEEIAKARGPVQHFPLAVCFRCDSDIIALAQTIEPLIQAKEGASSGSVSTITYDSWFEEIIDRTAEDPHCLTFDAVLCRCNAPLLALAFRLRTCKIPCRIEGKDLGYSLIRLIEQLQNREEIDLLCLDARLDDWIAHQRIKHAEVQSRLALAEDRYECAKSCISGLQPHETIKTLISTIRDLFSDKDYRTGEVKKALTLSSIHKAKGREWPSVYLLAPDALMPHPKAKGGWQARQEKNLMYVAYTRAKHNLVSITHVPL